MIPTSEKLNGVSGIYAIIERDTGKCYVGSSVNIGARRSAHSSQVRNGGTACIHRTMRTVGANAFDFEVLERCGMEHLLSREKFYIQFLNAASVNGFNVSSEPLAFYNGAHSPATRERIRALKLNQSDETILRISSTLTGRVFSDETLAKMRASSKGRPLSKAATDAAQIANTGRVHSEESRRKRSAALKGRVFSDETKAKMSAAKKGKPLSAEHRANLCAAQQNRPTRSDETRAKLSASIKTSWIKRRQSP